MVDFNQYHNSEEILILQLNELIRSAKQCSKNAIVGLTVRKTILELADQLSKAVGKRKYRKMNGRQLKKRIKKMHLTNRSK